MTKLLPSLIAVTFAAVMASVYTAEPQEPGRSGDPVSAEKKQAKKHKKANPAGAHATEPGRSGDPMSAEKSARLSGEVKAAGAHGDEPGRSGDPACAEKPKKVQ